MKSRLQTIEPRKFSTGDAAASSICPRTFSTALAILLAVSSMGALAANAASASLQQPTVPPTQFFGVPMQFEKNSGQTDARVDFLARGPGYTLFLTSTQAVFSLGQVRSSGETGAGQQYSRGDTATLEMVLDRKSTRLNSSHG